MRLVAGLIVNSTREAIERARLLQGFDIAALRITPVHYLFKPDAEHTVWINPSKVGNEQAAPSQAPASQAATATRKQKP